MDATLPVYKSTFPQRRETPRLERCLACRAVTRSLTRLLRRLRLSEPATRRCRLLQAGTTRPLRLATDCMMDNPLGAHPNGRSRPAADHIVCSDLMACTYSVRRFLGLSLPHSSNRPSFASRSEANLSHVLARSDHIFLASGSFAVCAMRTQSSAC